MKIVVRHAKPAAHHLFYPADDWTKLLFATLYPHQRKSFSKAQIKKLKKLGFEIEIHETPIKQIEL